MKAALEGVHVQATGGLPFCFSEPRRQDLRRLGLSHDQIREIESNGLPAAANYLKDLDRTDDVKRWLRKLRHAAKGTGTEMDIYMAQAARGSADAALMGAVRRIALAAYNLERSEGAAFDPAFTGDDGLARIGVLRSDRGRLLAVIDAATAAAPPQRRRSAGAGAVRAIWDVVSPMGIQLSSSPSSPFREIVGYCFEAVLGTEAEDPERAIREVIKQERDETRG